MGLLNNMGQNLRYQINSHGDEGVHRKKYVL